MSLYAIQYDSENDYVEADDYSHAIIVWREHYWQTDDFEVGEMIQPEQVVLITEEPVIRANQ